MLNKNESSITLTTLTLLFYNMVKRVYCELLELLAYLQMQILHLIVSSVLKSFVKSAIFWTIQINDAYI